MGANWQYALKRGREKRLDAELEASRCGKLASSSPPLFSHDATIQSYFNRGWHSVDHVDVAIHIGTIKLNPSADLLQKIQDFKHEHLGIH